MKNKYCLKLDIPRTPESVVELYDYLQERGFNDTGRVGYSFKFGRKDWANDIWWFKNRHAALRITDHDKSLPASLGYLCVRTSSESQFAILKLMFTGKTWDVE